MNRLSEDVLRRVMSAIVAGKTNGQIVRELCVEQRGTTEHPGESTP